MFGRSSKKPDDKRKNRDLSQYGLFNIPTDINLDGDGLDDDDDDSDMEAELAAITAGTSKPRPKPKAKPQIPAADLDRMIAESMKDLDDEDLSDDDDDPSLLNELSEITDVPMDPDDSPEDDKPEIIIPTSSAVNMPAVLRSRIEMYKIAEQNAKTANDTGRARRFVRGLKTLESQLKQAIAGKPINMDDVPPEVTTKLPTQPKAPAEDNVPEQPTPPKPASPPPSVPVRVAPVAPTPETPETKKPVDEEKISILLARQREYKMAALTAKKEGDTEKALGFVKIAKMFDVVIKAAQDGQEVDLSDMPPSPGATVAAAPAASSVPQPPKEEAENQHEAAPAVDPIPVQQETLVTASTVLEALIQRLDKYKSVEQAAKDEDNTSKARRFGRIVKQYEDAIKRHKAGKPVPFDELPTPPGFGPIPGVQPAASAQPAVAAVVTPAPPPKPTLAPTTRPTDENVAGPSPPKTRPPLVKQESTTRSSGNHSSTTVMNKTIQTILDLQKEFRNGAIEAKKAGEIDTAKEYLKIYKGLENLLNVARGGLPVDLSTLPIAPSKRANLEDSFTFINNNDCSTDDLSGIGMRLEEQLQKQLAMCRTTRDHHKALGDVAGTNRFENLALSVQKDYDIVKVARRNNLPVPKFHYEQKSFNIVKCNTDLTETELEINVLRGISYSVANPKEVDTYIKIEFPYPQETPFRTKTQLVRDTDSPEYNEKFKAEIQPKLRQCQRVFKRQAIKFEVYSKGGFLRSDTLIGTVQVKLQPLETACSIHDSFSLMDGRKTTGGKLEVQVRIKNPILTKQIEHIEEKWLIIDS